MYGLTRVTAPAREPVDLEELQDWCRDASDASVPILYTLGMAAREMAEKLTGRAFITQTWGLTLDGFPWPNGWQAVRPAVCPDAFAIRLPKAPLQSVTSITYVDMAGTLRTLAPTVYDVDAASDPGRVTLALGQTWPVTRPRPGAVRVEFVAGYGDAETFENVPEVARLAIKMAVLQWFENRGEADMTDLPAAAKALLLSQWNGELEYGL